MIRYALRCAHGHAFDGWFASADGFEAQRDRGLLSCAACGSARVDRALMAPPVRSGRAERPEIAPEPAGPKPAGPEPQDQGPPAPQPGAPRRIEVSRAEAAIAELRRRVEAHSTYVGRDFAAQARAMHDGQSPHRAIHGEAAPEEARALLEDGVPVAALPFGPRSKAN